MTQFEHEIFISYAHADNAGDLPWVSRLVEQLDISLRQRLGRRVNIFFDSSGLRGNDHESELLRRAEQSLLFVPILSPTYITNHWPQDELRAFLRREGADRRVFALEYLPPDDRSRCPPPLDRLIATPFWFRPPQTVAPIPVSPDLDRERFAFKIADFAEKLRAALVQPAVSLPPVAGDGPPRHETVLLAQVTGDLDAQADQMRSYLEQFGYRVLPEGNYPQGGAEFRAAFGRDAAQAAVLVQLLGPWSERRPPDLPEGYAQCQLDLAEAAGLAPMLWCAPDLDDAARAAHRDAAMFRRPELMCCGIEEFKAAALSAIRAQAPPPEVLDPASDGPERDDFIFIDTDRVDLELARKIAQELERRRKQVYLPLLEGAPEDILRDLEESLAESNGLVIVFGAAAPAWVRARLRFASKLGYAGRTSNRKVIAVYLHPPRAKEDLGVMSADIIWVDGQHPQRGEILSQALTGAVR